jgi:D-amino peptidase
MDLKKSFFWSCCFFSLIVFFSCNGGPKPEASPGRIISDPAPDTDGVIKILLYYDMEGISGQNDIRSLDYGNEEYEVAREWLTNDVNAVISGLIAGGADVVDVVDAHGSGNPQPDILVEKMDSRAQLLNKDERFRPYVDLTEKDIYDAVAVVCMHSKTGGGGFAAHTYTLGMDWILNDMSINETEIIAYSWGRADVPVIFASGDNTLKKQLEWMTWLEFVTVKIAKSADDAELIPFDEVHKEMQEASQRAVENLSNSKAVKLSIPIKAQLRAVPPARLDQLEGVPGIAYKDQTVTFEAKDYLEAYNGIEALISVATRGYIRLINEALRDVENSEKILTKFREMLNQRWMDVESGRWEPPAPPPKKEGTQKKYFGVS